MKIKERIERIIDILKSLKCPFLFEDFVRNVLLGTEQRYQLLEWLFNAYDPNLKNYVKVPAIDLINQKNEASIQRIFHFATFLGLSSQNDIELIRGIPEEKIKNEVEIENQLKFFETLCELVIIAQQPKESFDSNYSKFMILMDEVAKNRDSIFQTTSEQVLLNPYFPPPPKNLKFSLSDLLQSQASLEATIETLSQQLKSLQAATSKYVGEHRASMEEYASIGLLLKTQIKQFKQTVEKFNQIFSIELKPWTKQTTVQLDEKFHTILPKAASCYESFSKVLRDLQIIKSSNLKTTSTKMDSLVVQELSEESIMAMEKSLAVLKASQKRWTKQKSSQ